MLLHFNAGQGRLVCYNLPIHCQVCISSHRATRLKIDCSGQGDSYVLLYLSLNVVVKIPQCSFLTVLVFALKCVQGIYV